MNKIKRGRLTLMTGVLLSLWVQYYRGWFVGRCSGVILVLWAGESLQSLQSLGDEFARGLCMSLRRRNVESDVEWRWTVENKMIYSIVRRVC